MIFCVLDDPSHLDPVLEAWYAAGIGGVTIADSTGFSRKRQPLVPMRYIFGAQEPAPGNVTLFAIVENEQMIRRCLESVEKIVGNLDEPHTGVFASWPLAFSKGEGGKSTHPGEAE